MTDIARVTRDVWDKANPQVATELKPLMIPLVHPKKKRRNYVKVHGFHTLMAEMHECQARPRPHVPKRRFTFDI